MRISWRKCAKNAIAVIVYSFVIWCFIALLVSPSSEVDLEDIDVNPTNGYVVFKYVDHEMAVDNRQIVVKCCDSRGNTVFTTRHASPDGGTATFVRFVGDYLVVFLERYDLIRVYDLEGNKIEEHDISPLYFSNAEARECFEENAQKWNEISGVQYKYEKGTFGDFLFFKMYYRLVAVSENGDKVVIYQSR